MISKEATSPFYTRLVSNLLFPLHERLKRHDSRSRLHALERSQWLSPAEITSLQLANLRAFLRTIATTNPYYRDLFANLNVDPDAIESVDDLARLPLLSKDEIRKAQAEMISQNSGRLQQYNTGGSSGEPLIFYMGMDRISHDVAAKWRATRWWNVDIGDVEAVIWGSPVELGKQDQLKALRDRLFRSHLIPAFDLRPDSIRHYLSELQRLRPRMVFGYPSVIHQLTLAAADQNVNLRNLGTLVVFTTSEMLYPHQREAIETAFDAPVANGYGARDAGFIAHQCPAGGLHISAEDIVVEIVDADGTLCPPGTAGEIVITHTATSAFPFVRYRTGDTGRLSDQVCACGRGLPLLQEVQGRTTDFITATDGAKVHALALIYVIREIEGVDQFKISQFQPNQVTVQLKVNSVFDPLSVDRIESGMKARLGADMIIVIEEVCGFPTTANGKFRYVESSL
ncbi:phenylacetate--CoA ligase family protein [Motiliproteus sediminis]|uniref:phenylacetate--CoA ligase family protein n=1 Tax=Motiliproteus sediminis TaxID=1468178 RepID=UPI001AEF92BD|nr:AMP-binding protein [Motiliproteus sediminis]